jgi:hypothetical protein
MKISLWVFKIWGFEGGIGVLVDDDGDGEEPSGITLHSEGTHRTGGASTDASDGSYHPGRPSGPRQSSEEPATTTEGRGQEQEHDGTQGG